MRALKARLYRWISERYMPGCSNYNSLEVRKASRSKKQARDMFERHGFPHAQGRIFTNPFTARAHARELGFPLVIKPNVSGFSRGSHFPLRDDTELWRAALWVKAWWPSSVVEQYLEGANYRVLATQDEIVSVIRRYPPFVDGNGEDSISKLIDVENATRVRMDLPPTIHTIEKSPAVIAWLRKHGRDLTTVPAEGERVTLFHRIALAPGGVVETIPLESLPEVNRQLFLDVVKAFDATLFGIDAIFEQGIDSDYRTQKCILLEVNSRPYTRMHSKPRFGTVPDLDDFYARMDAMQVADTDTF